MADFDNRLSERGSLMEPIIWLGVLAVLLVIEGLTTALTTIWFAGGALAAAIAAGIGMGIVPQLCFSVFHWCCCFLQDRQL